MLDRVYLWRDKLGRLALGTKSVAYWMTVENFDFRPNICHKGKGNGVRNRGGKQVTTVAGRQ